MCRCELGNIVGNGDAKDARVSGLREETEDVFVVEVAVGEGAGDVDAALDLQLLRMIMEGDVREVGTLSEKMEVSLGLICTVLAG